MQSQIIAKLDLSRHDLEEDIGQIQEFTDDNQQYSEFRIGDWKTYVLWNQSGRDDDGLVADVEGDARPTPRGHKLSGINELIKDTFDTGRLKLVRAHCLGDGVLIPHRDFVEIEDAPVQWLRVHLPLQTNEGCLHSEDGTVFRMKQGEVWILHAANTHSACNFSDKRRINLCLDFEAGEAPMESLFKDPSVSKALPPPTLVQRSPMNDTFLEGIYEISKIIDQHNYRDIVGLLSKIHFYKKVDIREFHRWLVEISEMSGDAGIFEKSKAFKTFLTEKRSLHERFAL